VQLQLNILSFALLGAGAVAYARRRFAVLWAVGVLFFPVAASATVVTFWQPLPLFAVFLLTLTLGVSLAALALYGIDVVFAPFCFEMTYLTVLCWLLCPLLVFINFLGLLAHRLGLL